MNVQINVQPLEFFANILLRRVAFKPMAVHVGLIALWQVNLIIPSFLPPIPIPPKLLTHLLTVSVALADIMNQFEATSPRQLVHLLSSSHVAIALNLTTHNDRAMDISPL